MDMTEEGTWMTEREKQLLWIILHFHCVRYIMANDITRPDGAEKASEHIFISKMFAHYINCDGGCYTIRDCRGVDEWPKGWEEIHGWSERYITDILDVSIGLPLNRKLTHEEIEEYAYKLFDKFCYYFVVLESEVNKAEHESMGCYNGGKDYGKTSD